MFISQGPRGSLQAGGKICWVSSVTFIGWELHYISFFFHPFPRSSSLPLAETVFWQSMCVHACVCVSVCTFLWACCVCLHSIFDPVVTLQAPAHTTSVTVSTTSPQFSAYKFHCCALKDRHVFLSLFLSLSLSLSLLSCSHHFTSVRLPFVSRLHTFHHRPYLISLEQKWHEKKFF